MKKIILGAVALISLNLAVAVETFNDPRIGEAFVLKGSDIDRVCQLLMGNESSEAISAILGEVEISKTKDSVVKVKQESKEIRIKSAGGFFKDWTIADVPIIPYYVNKTVLLEITCK